MTPKFKHDCDVCKFMGRYNDSDLYFCGKENGHFSKVTNTVIARYGSRGPEYISGIVLAKRLCLKDLLEEGNTEGFAALRVAYLMAIDFGFLPPGASE